MAEMLFLRGTGLGIECNETTTCSATPKRALLDQGLAYQERTVPWQPELSFTFQML
jgi:hypothetical protein